MIGQIIIVTHIETAAETVFVSVALSWGSL
jgi:hypothetical protein